MHWTTIRNIPILKLSTMKSRIVNQKIIKKFKEIYKKMTIL